MKWLDPMVWVKWRPLRASNHPTSAMGNTTSCASSAELGLKSSRSWPPLAERAWVGVDPGCWGTVSGESALLARWEGEVAGDSGRSGLAALVRVRVDGEQVRVLSGMDKGTGHGCGVRVARWRH